MKCNRKRLEISLEKKRKACAESILSLKVEEGKEIVKNNKKKIEWMEKKVKEARSLKDARDVKWRYWDDGETLDGLTRNIKVHQNKIDKIGSFLEQVDVLCGQECIVLDKDLARDIGCLLKSGKYSEV